MTDLSRILDGLFEGLGDENASEIPTFPTSLPTMRTDQVTDNAYISHTSRISHTENRIAERDFDGDKNKAEFLPAGSRETGSYVESVGSVGSVGKEVKTTAISMVPLFPQEIEKVGSVGREDHAGPQSDWWNADHLAALAPQLAPPTPPGDPLPISPADVRAGVDRELQALAARGRTGPAALRDAIAITRAKIRNSPALAERQAMVGRCHICTEPLDESLPVVAVLTGQPGSPLFLHAGCHEEHSRRMADRVERVMAAAGLGADTLNEVDR